MGSILDAKSTILTMSYVFMNGLSDIIRIVYYIFMERYF